MSDDNNNPPPANLTELTEKITQLSAQLEQAKTALTERDTKIQELEGTTGVPAQALVVGLLSVGPLRLPKKNKSVRRPLPMCR
jgi:hypothetical protein